MPVGTAHPDTAHPDTARPDPRVRTPPTQAPGLVAAAARRWHAPCTEYRGTSPGEAEEPPCIPLGTSSSVK
ncbi:PIN domain protein [Streptomyces sp. NBRC 110611]|nr:PIN domain protein [Streptomyces sp. NBRC 110611]